MPIETKPAPKAVVILTQQYHDARMRHAEELAAVALQEAMARIEALEARLEALEA